MRSRAAGAVLAVLIALFGFALLAVAIQGTPVDAYTYLAAGERLDAGHELYRLQPGDRAIIADTLDGIPLLSPPPVAIIWRPLAVLGEPTMRVWALASGLAFILTAAFMVWRFPPAVVTLLPFLDGFGWTVSLGNVNGFLALGMLGVWKLRRQPWAVGMLAVTLAAVKLSPAPLVLWTARDRRTWLPIAATTLGWLIACAIFAPGAISQYVGLTHATGGPVWPVLLLGGAATLLLPRRWAFVAAVWTGLLASPVTGPYWFVLGIASLAPWTDTPTTARSRTLRSLLAERAALRAHSSGTLPGS